MIQNLPAKWDIEADVASIGSGIAGLSATLVLGRRDQIGGVTDLAMDGAWFPKTHLARELGIDDSAESGLRDLKRLPIGMGHVHPDGWHAADKPSGWASEKIA